MGSDYVIAMSRFSVLIAASVRTALAGAAISLGWAEIWYLKSELETTIAMPNHVW